jgi:serine/threonine-protein kinase HipA
VPECRLEQFNSEHHTFMSKRFDRTEAGKRIHLASAMTMLGRQDGADHTANASYLDIAAFIARNSNSANTQLEQLWLRILFSVLVSNTDDHLRNHAFMLREGAWVLSPAFDMNPTPDGYGLSLNISETDNALDVQLVQQVAPMFRLARERADQLLVHCKQAVSQWETVAGAAGIPRGDRERMRTAFRLAQ